MDIVSILLAEEADQLDDLDEESIDNGVVEADEIMVFYTFILNVIVLLTVVLLNAVEELSLRHEEIVNQVLTGVHQTDTMLQLNRVLIYLRAPE